MEVIQPRSTKPAAKMVRHVEDGCPYREDDVMHPEKDGVKTGTTIMGVVFDGGVVMACDTRMSTGDYVASRTSRKISKVYDRIFVGRSGSAADCEALTAFVTNYLGQHALELGSQPTVQTAANLFRLIAYNNKDHLMAGFLIGGYDDKRGGQVYSLPLGGSLVPMPWAADGSGSSYISGYCHEYYKEGMTKQEALAFVQKAISHAMSLDGYSGGFVRTLVVTAEGLEESVIEGDKLPVPP
mmetsp:Transcript_64897/g.154992  ORF Transcript_64897/g.154992 Transcript_64897/m.154992 type:complete len:240 (-) Transcript_64897:161-880(-)|eukprot:CAMPEP_0178405158 /NCGR_PEP_ID=MMETSP0689_2-20121128/18256_1 /TAXON_ID=160604 /ORGANISM="Amphidinium massartii, Strain CS-259" /LENGTH=239 /DNA_ID=CAMNT_0020026167 /DNA_START=107 /DNA_END=829 /DNA_ORIENTATION=+